MKTKNKIIIASIVAILIIILVVGAAVIFPRVTHEHSVSEIKSNEHGHWYSCANGCDKMLDENGNVIEVPLTHDFSGEAIYIKDNQHAYRCTICGIGGYNKAALTSTPCVFEWQKDGPNSVEGTHFKQCRECKHIDESTIGNHYIDEGARNHWCSACGLVNVFGDIGAPIYHYFEDGIDSFCSVEGCNAFLEPIYGSKEIKLWPWGKYQMLENGCDEEHGCISCAKYFLKMNYTPYKNSDGRETWNSTPIMIIEEYTHGDYNQHFEQFISDLKDQYQDDVSESGVKEALESDPHTLFTSDVTMHMNWYDTETGNEYEWGSSAIGYTYGSGWLPKGREIAIAPEYDEENHEWVFDLSKFKGHFLILRIENVAGSSEGIYVGEIFKNE